MKTYTIDPRKIGGRVTKRKPQWKKPLRKISEKTQKALEQVIEEAMNDSSEESVLEFLRAFVNNY